MGGANVLVLEEQHEAMHEEWSDDWGEVVRGVSPLPGKEKF